MTLSLKKKRHQTSAPVFSSIISVQAGSSCHKEDNGDLCQWFHGMVNFIFTAIHRDKPLWPAGAVFFFFSKIKLQKQQYIKSVNPWDTQIYHKAEAT
jgi:hypothetical protein